MTNAPAAAATVDGAPALDPGAQVPAEYDVFCESCGYSLLGITGGDLRCPECGATFDPDALPFARVPWLHRRRLGAAAAYIATVRMVLAGPRRFAHELCRPVRISVDDARRFRAVTIWVAVVSIAITAVAVGVIGFWRTLSPAPAFAYLALAAAWVAYAFAFRVFLALGTDMPVFIWKGLPALPPAQLSPIHHYASAPLALAPVLGLIITGAAGMISLAPTQEVVLLSVAAVAVVAVPIAVTLWLYPVVLMRAATGCSMGRAVLLAFYLPVHWCMMLFMVGLCALLFTGIIGATLEALLR